MHKSLLSKAVFLLLVLPLVPLVGLMYLADWLGEHSTPMDKWADWAAKVANRFNK